MKKLLLAGALLFMAACSTSPTHSSHYPPIAVIDHEPTYTPVQSGDRMPAGEPRQYWKPAVKTLRVTGAQGGIEDIQMVVQHIMEWEEVRMVPSTCPQPVEGHWTNGTCDGWDCSAAGGAGQSQYWNAFYSAPKERKAAALADAIDGVGQPTAEKLVVANVFHQKPRSWEAFVQAMQGAAARGVIGKDIVYQTTVKYRSENLVKLGYSAGACRYVQYSCPVYVDASVVMVPCSVPQSFTQAKEIGRIDRTFRVEVRNPKLQSFESDSITITAGHDPADVKVSVDGYTDYTVEQAPPKGNHGHLVLTGTNRIRVGLPQAALKTAAYMQNASSARLTVQVDPRYIPDAKDTDQLILHYVVKTCKPSFGLCVGKWLNMVAVERPITSADTAVDINVAKGLKTKVSYAIGRRNSPWYNDKFLTLRETDDFKMK